MQAYTYKYFSVYPTAHVSTNGCEGLSAAKQVHMLPPIILVRRLPLSNTGWKTEGSGCILKHLDLCVDPRYIVRAWVLSFLAWRTPTGLSARARALCRVWSVCASSFLLFFLSTQCSCPPSFFSCSLVLVPMGPRESEKPLFLLLLPTRTSHNTRTPTRQIILWVEGLDPNHRAQ